MTSLNFFSSEVLETVEILPNVSYKLLEFGEIRVQKRANRRQMLEDVNEQNRRPLRWLHKILQEVTSTQGCYFLLW